MTKNEQLKTTADFLKKEGFDAIPTGIILGTGLNALVHELTIKKSIPYNDIPYFPKSSMEYHAAQLHHAHYAGRDVLVFEGRFHAYEALDYFSITYPVRVMHSLGTKRLIISNAAGAINLDYNKGEVMLIDDHINLQGGSPLAEKDIDQLGPRFVDMRRPYDKKMMEICMEVAHEHGLLLHRGVYAAVLGPQLETRAEYRYLKTIGADAVGMSTVPEVIVANQLEFPCIAFSALTDVCDPDALAPIDLEDIFAQAKKAEEVLIVLVKNLIQQL